MDNKKLFYEAPSTICFEVKIVGAILQASSDPQYNGFGKEEEM